MKLAKYATTENITLAETLAEYEPWNVPHELATIIETLIPKLGSGYHVENGIAIHETAQIHPTAIIVGPAIVGPDCFLGPHAYLRSGAILSQDVTIGGSCEIKSSIVLDRTAVAHLNYVGNSVLGSDVNIEAGAVLCNHYNEREDKQISVKIDDDIVATGVTKFGALVGDRSRIGANAVTSPGTILKPGSVVARLELVDQMAD